MTTFSVAQRLRGVEASPTLALAAKAKALKQAGKPIVDLTAGEPDFPTPASIKQAAVQAIERNQTKYTPVAGIPDLRAAIAARETKRLGVPYTPTHTLVSCGAKHVLYNALQTICDPGDEVLIFTPFWVSYTALVQLADAVPILVETAEADQYQPDPAAVRAAITNRTKAIILNSPSNPTGMIIDRDRLRALAALALERELIVISDEIYDQLTFPPHRNWSIVEAEPAVAGQTLVVNGVSKTYSMTGWRIGYAVGPKELIEPMSTLQSHATSNPASISQHAALAALTGDQTAVADMRTQFQQRRDRFVGGLNSIPGVSCLMPQGAFYAWCNVGRLGQPAQAIAERWLEEIHVAVVPGEGFGSAQHVRFSFAAAPSDLDEALARIRRWVSR